MTPLEINPINYPFLIGTLAAFLHVITGPDHLAAVAPLAIESNKKAWKVGLSWGGGHITGMLLIGVLYLIFKDLIPFKKISEHSEFMVGFVLIFIGIWSFFRIFRKTHHHAHPHVHQTSSSFAHVHKHHHHENEKHEHPHNVKVKNGVISSFLIGTLHGFAGVSHFILLLPTLSFQSTTQSSLYISGFALGTLIAMTSFAFLTGTLAKKFEIMHDGKAFTLLRTIAGLFAMVIGIYWLTL